MCICRRHLHPQQSRVPSKHSQNVRHHPAVAVVVHVSNCFVSLERESEPLPYEKFSVEGEEVKLHSGGSNGSDEGSWGTQDPEPGRGCMGLPHAEGRQPLQALAENACGAAALWRCHELPPQRFLSGLV